MGDPKRCTLVFLLVQDGRMSSGHYERVAQVVNALSLRDGVVKLILEPPTQSREDIRKWAEVERMEDLHVVAVTGNTSDNAKEWDLTAMNGEVRNHKWMQVADSCLTVGMRCIDDDRPEHLLGEVDKIIAMAHTIRVPSSRSESTRSHPPAYHRVGHQQLRRPYFT